MPVLFFIEIGLMAGRRGIADAVFAAIDQKEARKVNERTNELLKNVLTEDERRNMIFRPKPILPALKENALQSIKAGASAALGTYAAAVILSVLVRNIVVFSLGQSAERCTVIGILGKGSVVAAATALAGIAVCAAGSVLGTNARKEAEDNLKMAYSNLFTVKQTRRQRKVQQQSEGSEEEKDAMQKDSRIF